MEYRLIVFLGNPGQQYRRTRHNVGWMVAERMRSADRWQGKFKGRYSKARISVLLMPETYMNRCGESVQGCAAFFSIDPEEILVVHDETELRLGELQLKEGGGTAGHNGLKSIREHLGTGGFHRLRVGVGRPERGSLSAYVLSTFAPEESALLERILDSCAVLIDDLVEKRDSPLATRLASGNRITPAEPG